MNQNLAHIAILVDDYDKAIAFYTQKLHFMLVVSVFIMVDVFEKIVFYSSVFLDETVYTEGVILGIVCQITFMRFEIVSVLLFRPIGIVHGLHMLSFHKFIDKWTPKEAQR